MPEPRFIHLRVHSAYSLLEGAVPLKKLPDLCAAADMPAVALTDTGNLFGALEFSEAAAKAARPIQPIAGCQLALAYAEPAHPGDRPPTPRPIVLLAQDENGFLNLMRLSSLNYLACGAAGQADEALRVGFEGGEGDVRLGGAAGEVVER